MGMSEKKDFFWLRFPDVSKMRLYTDNKVKLKSK